MNWGKVKIGSFLNRIKKSVEIENSIEYKRITIRTKHQGICMRDSVKGTLIGTKLQFLVSQGQFILSKIDARLGAFGIVPYELDGGIITGNFWAFDVDKKRVNIEWFNLFTSSGNFYDICNRASSGTTHRKYLDENKFLNFEIELPELYEQDAFIKKYKVYYISYRSLQSEICTQQSYVQQLREAILQEVVQGKLTKQNSTDEPATTLLKRIKAEKEKLVKAGNLKKEKGLPPITEDEIPFELPIGWVWCRLGELVNQYQNGISTRNSLEGVETIVLRLADISHRKINLKETRTIKLNEKDIQKYMLRKNDILIIRVNGSPDIVGRFVNVDEDENLTYCDHFIRVRLSTKEISSEYVSFVANSNYTRIRIEDLFITTAGQKTINQGHISSLLFPLAPLSEQQRIVSKVQQLLQELSKLETQVQQSRNYAQQLLQSVLKEAFENKTKEYEENEVLSLAAEE